MICRVVATIISGCGVCTACRVVWRQSKQQEWKITLAIARNSGFPTYIIHNLKKKLKAKKQQQQKPPNSTAQDGKKWVVFTNHSPLIRKVTNLF